MYNRLTQFGLVGSALLVVPLVTLMVLVGVPGFLSLLIRGQFWLPLPRPQPLNAYHPLETAGFLIALWTAIPLGLWVWSRLKSLFSFPSVFRVTRDSMRVRFFCLLFTGILATPVTLKWSLSFIPGFERLVQPGVSSLIVIWIGLLLGYFIGWYTGLHALRLRTGLSPRDVENLVLRPRGPLYRWLGVSNSRGSNG